jgi:hypothetical protein
LPIAVACSAGAVSLLVPISIVHHLGPSLDGIVSLFLLSSGLVSTDKSIPGIQARAGKCLTPDLEVLKGRDREMWRMLRPEHLQEFLLKLAEVTARAVSLAIVKSKFAIVILFASWGSFVGIVILPLLSVNAVRNATQLLPHQDVINSRGLGKCRHIE